MWGEDCTLRPSFGGGGILFVCKFQTIYTSRNPGVTGKSTLYYCNTNQYIFKTKGTIVKMHVRVKIQTFQVLRIYTSVFCMHVGCGMGKIHMYEKSIQMRQNYNSCSNYVNRTSPSCTNSSKIYLCIKYVFSLSQLTI